MPRGTIDRNQRHHYNLKSLPARDGEDGGYVVLRRLSFHEMMQRRDIAAKIGWETTQKSKKNRGRGEETETVKAMMEAMHVSTMEFEFSNSIIEHNIEDDKGALLDFTNPMTYKYLDPRIGAEISDLIDDLNEEVSEEDLETSETVVSLSSGDETMPPIISDAS